jgi:hypothetical protein
VRCRRCCEASGAGVAPVALSAASRGLLGTRSWVTRRPTPAGNSAHPSQSARPAGAPIDVRVRRRLPDKTAQRVLCRRSACHPGQSYVSLTRGSPATEGQARTGTGQRPRLLGGVSQRAATARGRKFDSARADFDPHAFGPAPGALRSPAQDPPIGQIDALFLGGALNIAQDEDVRKGIF